MIRILLPLFCLACMCTACNKRADLWVQGEVKGMHQSEVLCYGFRPDSNELVRNIPAKQGVFTCTLMPDSVWPVLFVFEGTVEIPVFALPGDEVTITGDMKTPSSFLVEGGDNINQALNEWRQKKEKPEAFLKAYPDHPASAWIILNEALSKPTLNTEYLKKLLAEVTPRMAESNMLSALKKELERPFSTELEIPFFSKSGRSIIRYDKEKIDSTFTHEQLKNRINTLITP